MFRPTSQTGSTRSFGALSGNQLIRRAVILCVFLSHICHGPSDPAIAMTLSSAFQSMVSSGEKDGGGALQSYLGLGPTAEETIELIRGIQFKKEGWPGFRKFDLLCKDRVSRPYLLYVPDGYNPDMPAPMLVYLHGSVTKPEIRQDLQAYAKESPFLNMADRLGYLVLFPAGQAGATWWDETGTSMVVQEVREVKKSFNVDDNRVFLAGFSDGGSGAYFFAMAGFDEFAAFVALNGHLGVGQAEGGHETYLANLRNRPIHAVTTGEDPLYPESEARSIAGLAVHYGIPMLFRVYSGIGHKFEYAPREVPRISRFMKVNPRNPVASSLEWEASDPIFGRFLWLSIDEINPDTARAAWHDDPNIEIVDDRIFYGFIPDANFRGVTVEAGTRRILGGGVRIDGVSSGPTLANSLGLVKNDIIIGVDGVTVESLSTLEEAKKLKRPGDRVTLRILRDGKVANLAGNFPLPRKDLLFVRKAASARIKASFHGNIFDLKTSRTGMATVYINPEMVQLDQKVKVMVNGATCFDDYAKPDPGFIARDYLTRRDRECLYICAISVRVPSESIPNLETPLEGKPDKAPTQAGKSDSRAIPRPIEPPPAGRTMTEEAVSN